MFTSKYWRKKKLTILRVESFIFTKQLTIQPSKLHNYKLQTLCAKTTCNLVLPTSGRHKTQKVVVNAWQLNFELCTGIAWNSIFERIKSEWKMHGHKLYSFHWKMQNSGCKLTAYKWQIAIRKSSFFKGQKNSNLQFHGKFVGQLFSRF